MRAYSLLIYFISASLCMAADPASPPSIHTPKEIIEHGEDLMHGSNTTLVRFRVGILQILPTTYPDGSTHQVIHLIPTKSEANGGFSVPIEPQFQKRLEEIGIKDFHKHFVGATITLEGRVSGTALSIYGSPTFWTYHVQLNSFDAIRSIVRPN